MSHIATTEYIQLAALTYHVADDDFSLAVQWRQCWCRLRAALLAVHARSQTVRG